MNDETCELSEEELLLLDEIKKVPGFEDIEPTEEGLEKLDNRFQGLEDNLRELLDQSDFLDKVRIKTKVHDLTREVTLTFQAKDDETFKVMQYLAPFVELVPIMAKADAL